MCLIFFSKSSNLNSQYVRTSDYGQKLNFEPPKHTVHVVPITKQAILVSLVPWIYHTCISLGNRKSASTTYLTYKYLYFRILWKSRCNILVSFPSHLKRLRSIPRFWLEKLNCGFFHSFHSRKNTTKQLFQSKFQCRK